MIITLAAGLVSRFTVLKEDAALASFYLISLAAGVVLVSLKGSNVDLLHVLFGSILALDDATLILLAAVTSISLLALAIIFRALVFEGVDPTFARLINTGGAYTNILFLSLVVINLVAGFHALGILLSVGLMMLPDFAARFWTDQLVGLMGISIGIGFLSSVIGIIVSYHLNTPTGPTIILASGTLYLFSNLYGQRSSLVIAKIHRPDLVP